MFLLPCDQQLADNQYSPIDTLQLKEDNENAEWYGDYGVREGSPVTSRGQSG